MVNMNQLPVYRVPVPTPIEPSDPECSNGILSVSSGVCCPLTCGQCGGSGCSQRPGGAEECCSSSIVEEGDSCDNSEAPCIVSSEYLPDETTSEPTTQSIQSPETTNFRIPSTLIPSVSIITREPINFRIPIPIPIPIPQPTDTLITTSTETTEEINTDIESTESTTSEEPEEPESTESENESSSTTTESESTESTEIESSESTESPDSTKVESTEFESTESTTTTSTTSDILSTPSPVPTRQPIIIESPSDTGLRSVCPVEVAEEMEVIFLVDNSCGLDVNQCTNRQEGISRLLESIKGPIYPHIGYLTYTTWDDIATVIPLYPASTSAIYDIKHLDCGPRSVHSADISAALGAAIDEFAANLQPNEPFKRRKIVIFSNGPHDGESVDPCSLQRDLSLEQGEDIEVVVVDMPCPHRVGSFDERALECLTNGQEHRYIELESISSYTFETMASVFAEAVCSTSSAPPTTESTVTDGKGENDGSLSTPSPVLVTREPIVSDTDLYTTTSDADGADGAGTGNVATTNGQSEPTTINSVETKSSTSTTWATQAPTIAVSSNIDNNPSSPMPMLTEPPNTSPSDVGDAGTTALITSTMSESTESLQGTPAPFSFRVPWPDHLPRPEDEEDDDNSDSTTSLSPNNSNPPITTGTLKQDVHPTNTTIEVTREPLIIKPITSTLALSDISSTTTNVDASSVITTNTPLSGSSPDTNPATSSTIDSVSTTSTKEDVVINNVIPTSFPTPYPTPDPTPKPSPSPISSAANPPAIPSLPTIATVTREPFRISVGTPTVDSAIGIKPVTASLPRSTPLPTFKTAVTATTKSSVSTVVTREPISRPSSVYMDDEHRGPYPTKIPSNYPTASPSALPSLSPSSLPSLSPTELVTLTPPDTTMDDTNHNDIDLNDLNSSKPTAVTLEGIVGYQCPAVGEECSSSIAQDDRCCDGQSGGSTRCKYEEWDDNGYKVGICCVRNNRRCTLDVDCCGDDMVCHLGYCLEPTRYDDNALHISDDGEFAEWVGDDAMEGEIYGISKSLQIAIVLVILMCTVCCTLMCWLKCGHKTRYSRPSESDSRSGRSNTKELAIGSGSRSEIVDMYAVRDRLWKSQHHPQEDSDEYASEEDEDANLYGHEEYMYRRSAVL